MSYTCVGRETEIFKLKHFLEKTVSGSFQICFIIGEAGSGKTTLINKFVEIVEKESPQTVIAIGECDSFVGISTPYLPFKDVLSMLTGDYESKVSQGRISRRTSENIKEFLATSIETVLEIGPDLIGSILPGGALIMRGLKAFNEKSEILKKIKSKTDVFAGAELNESTIFQQYSNVLNLLSQKQPLLIILDDLHWADSASISLLFHLTRKLASSRVMIVGIYRPNDILDTSNGRHPLMSSINEIKRYHGDVWIDLGIKSDIHNFEFVNSIIDIEPNNLDIKFRKKMYSLTEGNALFTTELLRNLKEKKSLVLDASGRWIESHALNWGDIPAKVEGVIEERVARLEKQLRDELTIASVEGENFTAQVISSLRTLSESSVLNNLTNELERKHRLVVENGEVKIGSAFLSFYRFGHSLIQQYLYNEIGHSERRILHKQVAEALESLYQNQVETISSQLARHYEEAGDIEKASSYLLISAENALKISAFLDAKKNLERALALGVPNIGLLIKLHQYLGKVYYGLSDYSFAKQEFLKGRDLAISISDKLSQAKIENDLGRSMLELDIAHIESQKAFESALQLGIETGDIDIQIRSLSELGAVLSYKGDWEKSQKLLQESLELASKKNKKEFIYTRYDLGCCYRVMDKLNEAEQVLVESIEVCKERKDLEVEGYSWTELAYTHYDLKDYNEAQNDFRHALSIGRETETKWTVAESLNGLGFISCDLEDLASAYNFFKEALSIYYVLKIYTGLLLTLIGFSNLFARQGKYSDSLELIGLVISHQVATSDVKQYADQVLKFIRTKDFSDKEIAHYIDFGAEKDIDFVVRSLLE